MSIAFSIVCVVVFLLGKSQNGALNCIDFALLKVRLTALVADLGRDCVEYQVISVAINMEEDL